MAYVAMLAFLPFSLSVARRLSHASAVAAIVLAGSLFLPEKVALLDVRFVPEIEKERLTYLCALIASLVFHRRVYRDARPGAGPEAIFLLVFVGFLCTTAFNRDPMFNYGVRQDPLGIYWILARSVDDLTTIFLPFLVGRTMFRNREDLIKLAYALVAAGLIYVPLIALEALLSIPFHVWQLSLVIYDVAIQPSWRWGGIQPVVFMENGLSNAGFMVVAAIMAAGFAASKAGPTWRGVRRAHLWTSFGLLMTRVSSCNIYGVVFGGCLRFFSARLASLLATFVAVMVCVYIAMRLADVFPDEQLVQLAREYVNEERARSFEGRFLEEDFVFDGLGDRLVFGWGMFDRIPGAATFGQGEQGLDSFMVIRTGLTGVVGVELIMLLLAIPVLVAWRRIRLVPDRQAQFLIAALMLCVAARMVDYLMNGLFNCLPFFLAGALHGVAKSIGKPDGGWEVQSAPDNTESGRQGPAGRRRPGRRSGAGKVGKR